MTGSDDLADLLVATAQGDRQAFARLYTLTSPILFGIVLRLLRRREWAAEVLQEAYLLMWQKAGHFVPERGTAMGWMVTLVRRCAIDALRYDGRQPNLTEISQDELEASAVTPEVDIEWMMTSRLAECLKELDDGKRQAILLAYHFGLTHSELSSRFGTPLGTIKGWLRQSLQRLKECLDP